MGYLDFFKKRKNIIPILEQYVDDVKNRRILSLKNTPYKKNSYMASESALVNFKRYLNGKPFYIESFTEELLKDFVKYLTDEGKAMNTIYNYTKDLTTMVRRLVEEKKIVASKKYEVPDIHLLKEVSTAIFTNEKELQKLLALDLSLTPKMELVRDMYVIQCYTGLRFSDLIRVVRQPKAYYREDKGEGCLIIKTEKTGQDLVIPLKKEVVKIFHRRNFKFEKALALHAYNRRLKDLGEFMEFDEEIVKNITKGGEKKELYFKKWEMLSSHTARRSFATNAYLNGVPTSLIRKMTGHTTEESLLRYIRASNHEIALKSKEYDFFK